jgi:hypothetical protein
MNGGFVSDFSLFPIKKIGRPGWEFRKATWTQDIETEIHKLYNGKISGPVYYDKPRVRDGLLERCKICKCDDEIHVEPGNGYDYIVRIDSLNNVQIESDNETSPESECIICFTNKITILSLNVDILYYAKNAQ